jgi:hypothetical protein
MDPTASGRSTMLGWGVGGVARVPCWLTSPRNFGDRDTLGNASAYLTSSPVAIARPTKPSPQPPTLRPAGIALTSTRRTPGTLTLAGRLHPDATGRVTARWSARRRPRRCAARATSAARAGAFKARLTIPRRARRIKRSTLTLSYSGDAAFRAERLRVTMRTR